METVFGNIQTGGKKTLPSPPSAVILAGGEGRRLRPLTLNRPKPLVRIGGRPVMSYILRLLAAHGFSAAAVTCGYMAEELEAYCSRSREGVKLECVREQQPLGTAGSTAYACDVTGYSGGELTVISGDALCEFDLTAAREFHRSRGAAVTMILSRVAEPSEYGVVNCDGEGRILRFSEKPPIEAVCADTVNTGVYILSERIVREIPRGRFCDFGSELFPALLGAGEALYGFTDGGYWCDIGSPQAYYDANMRVTGGTAVIGDGCDVSPEATVGAAVIGDGCVISDGCRVGRAILCDGVRIGRGVCLRDGALIGPGCVIPPNTTVEAGTVTAEGAGEELLITGDTIFGRSEDRLFEHDGLEGNDRRLTPRFCVRIGEAAAEAAGGGCVAVMTDRSPRAALLGSSLLCGIGSAGGRGLNLGEGCESMASFAATRLECPLTLFVGCPGDGRHIRVSLFDADGLYPSRACERSFSAALARPPEPVPAERLYPTERIEGIGRIYCGELSRGRRNIRLSLTVEADSGSEGAAGILGTVLAGMGCITAPDAPLRLRLTDHGRALTATDGNVTARHDEIAAVIISCLWGGEGGYKKISLPTSSGTVLCRAALRSGAEVSYYRRCPISETELVPRSEARRSRFIYDGVAAGAELAALIWERDESLASLLSRVERTVLLTGQIECRGGFRPSVMAELGRAEDEGVSIDYGRGRVRVMPGRNRIGLISEAASGEFAAEILDLARHKVEEALACQE